MQIDLPQCNFKFCRYSFDSNCTDEKKYQRCEHVALRHKDIPRPPEHKVHDKYPALGKNYYCGCGVMFADFERNGTNYCGNCGQKLREDNY